MNTSSIRGGRCAPARRITAVTCAVLTLIACAEEASLSPSDDEEAMARPATAAAPRAVPIEPAAEPEAAADIVVSEVGPEPMPSPARYKASSAPRPTRATSGTLMKRGVGRGGGGHGEGTVDDLLLSPYAVGSSMGSSASAGLGMGRRGVASRPAMNVQLDFDTEAYAHVAEQGFVQVQDSPLSTFSIDVDTASYSNVRRMLRESRLPPADAVRIEEMINYFRYAYPEPQGDAPVAIHTELGAAPWAPDNRLVQIGLRARDLERDGETARNLVFLVDVSGSMQSADKLPLLKRGLAMLARDLRPVDRLSIAVYAGASGLALPPTRGSEREVILGALANLEAGGSTNGAEGIELAYRVARNQFIRGGVNRVILATDGDFNVGVTSQGELVRLIEQQRKSGVFLTVLGFGTGNLKDSTMEALADKGNGNYAYIDSLDEAHKVLVREAGATLVTVAKDVKLQVEWNPQRVASYRLIGYENRKLADRDFNDDTKDAGEMGAGHTVTALYEVVLRGAGNARPEVDPLRYQADRAASAQARSGELLNVKLRYKTPDSGVSALISQPVLDAPVGRGTPAPRELSFAAAVAGFGMLLRGSEHKGALTLELTRELAMAGVQGFATHERRELIELMDTARQLGLL